MNDVLFLDRIYSYHNRQDCLHYYMSFGYMGI